MTKFLSDKMVKALGVAALLGLTTVTEAQSTYSWSPAGPILTAGRARNMVIDKTDPNGNIMYVGSVSSGIFKTTDAGVNWFPIDDQGTIRNISYLAQSADNTIYVGTGEGFLRPSQETKSLPGTGLYKLSGNNLIPVTNTVQTGVTINKIACHPTNADWIALATDKGILISVNGGSFFSNANGTPTTGVNGLDVKFDANGVLYCTAGSEVAPGPASRVYKANSADLLTATFNTITPFNPAVTNTNYGRIELGISRSNPNVIYASCAAKYSGPATATLSGLFVSYDAGSTWGVVLVGSGQLDPLFSGTNRASGDYAHCVVVNPTDPNQILMGGYYLYAFTRTGGSDANPVGSWIQLGNPNAFNTQIFLNSNIHDIKLVNGKYYMVTDAGIFRTIDNFLSFQPFYKGMVTGQFNSVSIERYPMSAGAGNNTPGTVVNPYSGFLGGTGGNGLVYFRGNYPNLSTELAYIGGDIYNTEFSKLLPNAAFTTLSNGSLFRTSDVKSTVPSQINIIKSTADQTSGAFEIPSYSVTGMPFKLWEYYGQSYKGSTLKSPDSLVFLNDSASALAAIISLTSAAQEYTFTIGRPQTKATIDHITIRATLVKVALTPSSIAVPSYSTLNTKTIEIQCSQSFTLPPPGTAQAPGTATIPLVSVEGFTAPDAATSTKVRVNSFNQLDEINLKLAGPLFTTYPTSNPAPAPGSSIETYMRLKATVYYRYQANDPIVIFDDNISTLSTSYTFAAQNPMQWTFPVTSTLNLTSNPIQKFASGRSARLAVATPTTLNNQTNSSILVAKAPLDMNTPLSFIKVSANKALTTDANGNPLSGPSNTVSVIGSPILLEWSKSGTELYYATDANNLYRVSNLFTILDSTSKSYGGKLHTGIFTFSNTPAPPTYTAVAFGNPNPRSPYRTTYLGTFAKKITSISVANNDSILALTFDDPTPTGTVVMVNTVDIRKCNNTNVGFTDRTGGGLLNGRQAYCSMLEKGDYKKMFVGTDRGIFYTNDITAAVPVWDSINKGNTNPATWLPKVQVFDIEQQTMAPWECYNSGQIYIATNGRGVWTNNAFLVPLVVSVEEVVKSGTENNLKVFPNPTNGEVHIAFKGYEGESATVNVMDINGKLVKTEYLGKLYSGDVEYSFQTSDLTTGVYIVNITSDSGMRRVSKLIVTK